MHTYIHIYICICGLTSLVIVALFPFYNSKFFMVGYTTERKQIEKLLICVMSWCRNVQNYA